jgi:hypothetical protein
MSRRRKEFPNEVSKESPTISAPLALESDRGLSHELLEQIADDVIAGRVITLKELQNKLKCSYETVRKETQKEPGVIRWGDPRIPYCVLRNMLKRLTRSGDVS